MVHNFNQFLQDLNEEKSESKSKPNLTFRDFDGLILEKDLQIEHVYRCVDKEMSIAIEHCLKKGIPKEFIKYGIGILGRESDYGQAVQGLLPTRYGIKSVPEYAINYVTQEIPSLGGIVKKIAQEVSGKENWAPSMGIAQMTPDVAKKYNVDLNALMTMSGSLYAACRYLKDLYEQNKKNYSEKSPSVIIDKGNLINNPSSTGNSVMDAAIISYNLGAERLQNKYCQTDNPGYAAPVNSPGGVYLPFPKEKPDFKLRVLKDKPIPNYLPNIKTSTKSVGKKMLDKMGWKTKDEYISSLGYLKEVVERSKKVGCI